MFGSDHIGERDTAARTAHQMITDHGMTWEELFTPARIWEEGLTDRATARQCLMWPSALTDWEFDFLQKLAGLDQISPKQMSHLYRIAEKVEAVAIGESYQ